MKDYIFKTLLFILMAVAGFMLVPIFIHLMIKIDMINGDTAPQGFLEDMLTQSTYVWMGAAVLGFISIFIQQNWRIILLLCPLVLPSLAAILYAAAKL